MEDIERDGINCGVKSLWSPCYSRVNSGCVNPVSTAAATVILRHPDVIAFKDERDVNSRAAETR